MEEEQVSSNDHTMCPTIVMTSSSALINSWMFLLLFSIAVGIALCCVMESPDFCARFVFVMKNLTQLTSSPPRRSKANEQFEGLLGKPTAMVEVVRV